MKVLPYNFRSDLIYNYDKPQNLSRSYKITSLCIWKTFFFNSVEVGDSFAENFMSAIPENIYVKKFSDYLVDNFFDILPYLYRL